MLRKTLTNEKRRKLCPRAPEYDSAGGVIAQNREKSGATEKSGCSESPCGSRAAGATRKNEKVGWETENEANEKWKTKKATAREGESENKPEKQTKQLKKKKTEGGGN